MVSPAGHVIRGSGEVEGSENFLRGRRNRWNRAGYRQNKYAPSNRSPYCRKWVWGRPDNLTGEHVGQDRGVGKECRLDFE